MINTLYFGDNLDWMRKLASESIDLVYLDPPFNSKAEYNKVWRGPTGQAPRATVQTFEDTWTWNQTARDAYDDVMGSNGLLATYLEAMRNILNDNDIMAYLAMMAIRLSELHRLLKPTGSLYLHCDPTASHYLKTLLDAAFGPTNFRSEIVWKRYGSHNDAKRNYAAVHDTIFYYVKSDEALFKPIYEAHDPAYVERSYRNKDSDGRLWRIQNLASPNPRPNLTYPYTALNAVTYEPHVNGWKYTKERMLELDQKGRLVYPKRPDGRLAMRNYLDEMKGSPLSDVWTDIGNLGGSHSEREGYQTQKPLSLLERIIQVSSKEGDVVLDPFCGCGTAIHAAQAMGRKWIGIDITHVAIQVVERRLLKAFGPGKFKIEGRPRDTEDAWALALRDRYQFQWWATSMVGAHPYGGYKKGADGGIDGIAYFKTGKHTSGFAVIQVKSDKKVGRDMIDKLSGAMLAKKADIGILICLAQPTEPMRKEIVNCDPVFFEGEGYPRLQILTIDEIFSKVRPKLPPLYKDTPDRLEARAPSSPVLPPEELRGSPRFKLSIPGGKSASKQATLPMVEPAPAERQARSKTRRRA